MERKNVSNPYFWGSDQDRYGSFFKMTLTVTATYTKYTAIFLAKLHLDKVHIFSMSGQLTHENTRNLEINVIFVSFLTPSSTVTTTFCCKQMSLTFLTNDPLQFEMDVLCLYIPTNSCEQTPLKCYHYHKSDDFKFNNSVEFYLHAVPVNGLGLGINLKLGKNRSDSIFIITKDIYLDLASLLSLQYL